jgi:hypothetical protein
MDWGPELGAPHQVCDHLLLRPLLRPPPGATLPHQLLGVPGVPLLWLSPVDASSGIFTATSSATSSTEGAPTVAPAEAAGAASPPTVAGGVAPIQGAASATGAPAWTSAAVGGAGGAVGEAAGPLAVVVEEACWWPDLPAEESPLEAEEEAGRVVLASIIKIRIQKKKERGQGELTTHVELRTPHPVWKIRDCLLPEAGARGDRRGSSTISVSGGSGGACCCWGSGGGRACGCCWGGGGGGACCCCS